MHYPPVGNDKLDCARDVVRGWQRQSVEGFELAAKEESVSGTHGWVVPVGIGSQHTFLSFPP